MEENSCLWCRRSVQQGVHCTNCTKAVYCETTCQTAHWRIHQRTCRLLTAANLSISAPRIVGPSRFSSSTVPILNERRSFGSKQSVYFHVRNNTSRAVSLIWLDFCAEEVHYCTIQPSEVFTQQTFVTHKWTIRDYESEATLFEFEAKVDGSVVVIAENLSAITPPRIIDISHISSSTAFRLKERRSLVAEKSVQFHIRNSTNRAICLIWLDFDAKEVPYSTIQPNEVFTQQTFVTHKWTIRDKDSKATLFEFEATDDDLVLFLVSS